MREESFQDIRNKETDLRENRRQIYRLKKSRNNIKFTVTEFLQKGVVG